MSIFAARDWSARRSATCCAAVAAVALGLSLATSRTAAGQASSADNHLDLGIGFRTGTLGFGGEVSKLIISHIGVRAGFNYSTFSLTHTISDVDYSATLRLETIPLLVDLFPFARGPFHLTGGLFINKTQFTGTGKPDSSGTISINHNQYTQAQIGVLSGAIKYPTNDGYLGLGFGTPAFKGRFAGSFDIGAVLSKPQVSLSATNPGNNPELTADLAGEQATTQTSVNKLAVYPVIMAGLLVRF